MDMEQKLQKVEELKPGLKSGQALFRKAKSQSEAAVKASLILAEEIAQSARPFPEGDFIKHCMLKVYQGSPTRCSRCERPATDGAPAVSGPLQTGLPLRAARYRRGSRYERPTTDGAPAMSGPLQTGLLL
ncbi:hypothetical protein D4764_14G0002050 [Takifugu flavidus]|uniref:Uncharacterized protein n=1 Tax=Takifugu flavidus TaxID=433684 RepID=A0A5C6P332_9TELE|nr:hypothetical protein D4764_14G0002050 [Takifugu flavidus]